jgi:hypothetical protein
MRIIFIVGAYGHTPLQVYGKNIIIAQLFWIVKREITHLAKHPKLKIL